MADQQLSYAAQQVRRYDNDRFLTALFAPADRRDDLLLLYAANLEIAKSREAVSEPLLGRIRLQWWREAIGELYEGRPRQHEILQPLAEAVRRRGLSRVHFDALIEAREADMDDQPPADEALLEAYAEATSAPLIRLALEVLGCGSGTEAAARHAGIAYAQVGMLRATAHLAAQRRRTLPDALLAKHGVRELDLFELRPSAALCAATKEVAQAARRHLTLARGERVPAAAVPALLPARLAELQLKRLVRAGYDPLAPGVADPHPLRHVALAWAAARHRF